MGQALVSQGMSLRTAAPDRSNAVSTSCRWSLVNRGPYMFNTCCGSLEMSVNSGTPTACYTVSPDPPRVFNFFTIDMSCSTGPIFLYRFWLNWFPGATPTYVGTQPMYTTISESALTFNTRLEIEDSSGTTLDTRADKRLEPIAHRLFTASVGE